GARPSHAHSTLPPFPSSTTTCSQVCGLTHSKSLTTPVMVMTFVTSYATLLWCGSATGGKSAPTIRTTKRTRPRVMNLLLTSEFRILNSELLRSPSKPLCDHLNRIHLGALHTLGIPDAG